MRTPHTHILSLPALLFALTLSVQAQSTLNATATSTHSATPAGPVPTWGTVTNQSLVKRVWPGPPPGSATSRQALKATNLVAHPGRTRTAPFIGQRGPDSRTWFTVTELPARSGHAGFRTNVHCVELATGVCYQENGAWRDAREEIELLAGGGGRAVQGQHKLTLPGDIYYGAIGIETPSGTVLRVRPLAVYYDDGANSALVAELTNSVGRLLPTKNQVLYPRAFGDLGDLRVTYRKVGVECDLILRQSTGACP